MLIPCPDVCIAEPPVSDSMLADVLLMACSDQCVVPIMSCCACLPACTGLIAYMWHVGAADVRGGITSLQSGDTFGL